VSVASPIRWPRGHEPVHVEQPRANEGIRRRTMHERRVGLSAKPRASPRAVRWMAWPNSAPGPEESGSARRYRDSRAPRGRARRTQAHSSVCSDRCVCIRQEGFSAQSAAHRLELVGRGGGREARRNRIADSRSRPCQRWIRAAAVLVGRALRGVAEARAARCGSCRSCPRSARMPARLGGVEQAPRRLRDGIVAVARRRSWCHATARRSR
jgi:hypothetical protein